MAAKDEYIQILAVDTSAQVIEERGLEARTRGGFGERRDRVKSNLVKLNQFGDNAKAFTSQVMRSFSDMEPETKAYELDEIELSVGIDAEGKFTLLGIGAGVTAGASIKLVFKRKRG